MKKSRVLALCAMLVFLAITLTGCVPGDGANTEAKPAGFLWGVWHGWIAPFSLIYSLFKPEIGIYEIHNSGFWYNLGYYIAIIGGLGSLSLTRRKIARKERSDD